MIPGPLRDPVPLGQHGVVAAPVEAPQALVHVGEVPGVGVVLPQRARRDHAPAGLAQRHPDHLARAPGAQRPHQRAGLAVEARRPAGVVAAPPLPERVVADAHDRERRHPAARADRGLGRRQHDRRPPDGRRAPAGQGAAQLRHAAQQHRVDQDRRPVGARPLGRRAGAAIARRAGGLGRRANWRERHRPIGTRRQARTGGQRRDGMPAGAHRSSKTSTGPAVAGDPDPPGHRLVGDADGVVAGVDRLQHAHVGVADLADRAALVVHDVERPAVGRDGHAAGRLAGHDLPHGPGPQVEPGDGALGVEGREQVAAPGAEHQGPRARADRQRARPPASAGPPAITSVPPMTAT